MKRLPQVKRGIGLMSNLQLLQKLDNAQNPVCDILVCASEVASLKQFLALIFSNTVLNTKIINNA